MPNFDSSKQLKISNDENNPDHFILTIYDYNLKQHEVFTTIQYNVENIMSLFSKTDEEKYNEIKNIISLADNCEKTNNTEYFSISPSNTADYDQLFVRTSAETYSFIKENIEDLIEDLKNNYFDTKDLGILAYFSKETGVINNEDIYYNSVYFSIINSAGRIIEKKRMRFKC